MGEARRRKSDERRGRPSRWRDARPLKPVKARDRQAAAVPERERAKRKREVKRAFGLTRRIIGMMEAGHLDHPRGYDLAMYQAKTAPLVEESQMSKAVKVPTPGTKPPPKTAPKGSKSTGKLANTVRRP